MFKARPDPPERPVPSPTSLPNDSTETSQFTDSAIDMSKSDGPSEDRQHEFHGSFAPTVALSERLEQLTTAVWEAEQDRRLAASRMQRLHLDLDDFENHLEAGADSEGTSQGLRGAQDGKDRAAIESGQEEQLRRVLDHLSDTISSMRLRQQEHQHLHQLSRTKLQAVAQRCLVQETQLRESHREIRDLRQENVVLGSENDTLRSRIKGLEVEARRREVAIDAMTSAVAGLEGWIEGVPPDLGDDTQSPGSRRPPRRTVIKGRGRFRGRYYVDELERSASRYGFNGESDAKDLHDGVRAWLRGFKDVEEETKSTRSDRISISKEVAERGPVMDEEWGEFEVVT